MRLYWEVARRSFRRYAGYRAATIAGAFTNSVFGIIRASILIAVFRHGGSVGGFDTRDAVTFAFLTQSFIALTFFTPATLELAQRVRTGDVVSDLYRPVDFQLYWLATDLGRATIQMVTRGVPPLALGALLFELRLPDEPSIVLAFAVSTVLAVFVSFGVTFIVNLSSFWLLDVRGPAQLTIAALAFFSGLLLPLVMFPGWLETTARLLPFASLMQLPAEVFLAKHEGLGLLGVLSQQLLWAVVLFTIGRLLLAAATRKVVVQGG
jgi:ABC-2 type transport system permease protein